jgi:PHD/YefM family antitoxin component YafN of YafNO toxin-antitoxin module
MINLNNIHSLTDFLRNHKEHVKRLRESEAPEVLTVNGTPELVLQTAQGYQGLLDRLEYAENVAGLRRAYRQVQEGTSVDFQVGVAEIRSKNGL